MNRMPSSVSFSSFQPKSQLMQFIEDVKNISFSEDKNIDPDIYNQWKQWNRLFDSLSPQFEVPWIALSILCISCLAFGIFHYLIDKFHSHSTISRNSSSNTPSSVVRYQQLYNSFTRHQQIEWTSHIVSGIHALLSIIAACVALWSCYKHFPIDSSYSMDSYSYLYSILLSYHQSTLVDASIAFSAGYLLYDLCMYVLHPSLFSTPLTLTHHVLILTAFISGLCTHIGTIPMSIFLVNEVSTIFLNINYFMSAAKLSTTYSSVYNFNAILLFMSFFIFRCILITAVVLVIFLYLWPSLDIFWIPSSPFGVSFSFEVICMILSLLAFCHCILNWVWFVMLSNAVRRKLSRGFQSHSKAGNRQAAESQSNQKKSNFMEEAKEDQEDEAGPATKFGEHDAIFRKRKIHVS